jgi:hypothetical protein
VHPCLIACEEPDFYDRIFKFVPGWEKCISALRRPTFNVLMTSHLIFMIQGSLLNVLCLFIVYWGLFSQG